MAVKNLSNKGIADILNETAALYEIEEAPFKPRAYERAALAVSSFGDSVAELCKKEGEQGLQKISGVGKGISKHIRSIVAGRPFREYEGLKKKIPVAVLELLEVEGIGPRAIKILWEKLGIKNRKDLEKAARAGRIAGIKGFGAKSQAKILHGIAFLAESGGRMLLGEALPLAREFEKRILGFPEVGEAVAAGSIRRMAATVGDIDILVVSAKPAETMKKIVKFPEIERVYGAGPSKINARLALGLQMDVRIVPRASFGAALNYFTGSKAHNIALREIAERKGWKLNEYGLFGNAERILKRNAKPKRNGEIMIAGMSEEELYKKLGFPYIEPELREMTGELQLARNGTLPALIGYGDVRGDLQMHTKWTDGQNTILEMAESAARAGLEYIAITDHTVALAMAGGLDGAGLAKQRKEIAQANENLKAKNVKLQVLQGAEVNIKKDGCLDIPDSALEKLDIVGAAVHSNFDLPRREQTNRLLRAMRHPLVQILYHPSARLINRRNGIDADWDAIIAVAKERNVALEIDASPERLDLSDTLIRKCVSAGAPLVIDSDAHSTAQLGFLELGIAQARRGFAKKSDVLNTLPLADFLRILRKVERTFGFTDTISHEEFERFVNEGVAEIPEKFRSLIANVAFLVEDAPSAASRRKMKLRRNETLFGLYEGIPRSARGAEYGGLVLPDRITIFKQPIEEEARAVLHSRGDTPAPEAFRAEVLRTVSETVWHEVAHHFGLNEQSVRRREIRRHRARRR